MTKYAKAIVALLGSAATWGVTAAEDSTYSQVELWGLLLAVTTALAVFLVPNSDEPVGESGHANTALVTCIAVVVIATVVVLWAFGVDFPLAD